MTVSTASIPVLHSAEVAQDLHDGGVSMGGSPPPYIAL